MVTKSVKPITGRQTGELSRLLEERGCDGDIFQRTMLENINGLCFFLRGCFGFAIGKTLAVKDIVGYICAIENEKIVAIAPNAYDYAMGNILWLYDEVKIVKSSCHINKAGRVITILNPAILAHTATFYKDIIRIELFNNEGIYSFQISDLSW